MLYKIVVFFFLFSLSVQAFGQSDSSSVTLSGRALDAQDQTPLPFANVTLHALADTAFMTGTITDDEGRFSIPDVQSGEYWLKLQQLGYKTHFQKIRVGRLSAFLDLGVIEMKEEILQLDEVVVTGTQDAVAGKMDKKTFNLEDNISQSGGSALEAMKNLPGVTQQDGKIQLRGSDKVTILIDGKQTALTGFGSQAGLDNIPASAIEKIEIIHNPSAKFDANGAAGVINIILKKEKKEGFNGKAALISGVGSLWRKRDNLPDIPPQYQYTPKINPSLSLNYRKDKFNWFFQGDFLWQQRLNKNEFTDRAYANGTVIHQQYQENRTQNTPTAKTGVDWFLNNRNTLTVSALYSREAHVDRGSLPYFNGDYSERNRLWSFYEHEVNTTVGVSATLEHKFKQPGHTLNASLNYNFQQENEKYWLTNALPTYTGQDSFKLLANQHVFDLNVDYIRPLKRGRIEGGLKFRQRYLPVNMQFFPGLNSPVDVKAGGWANYSEIIPALYGNYVYESKHFEAEAGLRMEYIHVDYQVTPEHPVYRSDGYQYFQPFPNLRLAYVFNEKHRVSFFYNRRVDRSDESDLRIFPKYDDPEILKVGNPALRPQYTQSFELGYKASWPNSYFYAAVYQRITDNFLTRIATATPNDSILYSLMQNAGSGFSTGVECVWNQEVAKWLTVNLALNAYYNQINAFKIENEYPYPIVFSAGKQTTYSGSAKLNAYFKLPKQFNVQLTGVYLAPDLVPQGKIASRFSLDLGVKKTLQKGKGELLLNITDIVNTMRIKKTIRGDGFTLTSVDFYETQIVRLGYSYKF